MMRYSLVLLMLLVGGCSEAQESQQALPVKELVLTDGEKSVTITAEVASTEEQRRRGLMFRENLPDNHGMLFELPSKTAHKFWMKNTLIPLDMIFFDEDNVVGIVENARPHDLAPVGPDVPSNYVLEVNGGFVREHDINTGWQKRPE